MKDNNDFYMPEPMDFAKLPSNLQNAMCSISKFMYKTVKLLGKNATSDEDMIRIAIMTSLKAGIEFSSDIKKCETCHDDCSKCQYTHARLLRVSDSLSTIPEHIQEEMLSDADSEIRTVKSNNELKSALNDVKDYL